MMRPNTFAALFCLLLPTIALAQPAAGAAPAAPPAGGGMRAGAGPVDPAQFRQKQLDNIREKLGATDEEWNALSPKVEKVVDAKREASTGAGMSFGSAVGRGAVFRSTGGSDIGTVPGKAMQELRASLEQKEASDDEIKKKLTAMREAREKARADLAAVQKELQQSCTPRQEATLVTLGILE